MSDAYHLPPSAGRDPAPEQGDHRRMDPDKLKAARERGGMPDGSVYDFDIPHRGANTSLWLSAIVVMVIAIIVLGLLVRIF